MRFIEINAQFDCTKNGLSKSSLLMKNLGTVIEFYLSTKIKLKSFNEKSFQCRKTKKRESSGKHTKSMIMIWKGAQLINI